MKRILYAIFIIAGLVIVAWYFFNTTDSFERINDNHTPTKSDAVAENQQVAVEDILDAFVQDFETLVKDFDTNAPFTIERIWIEDKSFYIEYSNQGGVLGQLLVVDDGENYTGIAYFIPSEAGWMLQAGEGELASPSALLYEANDQGQWIRKN